MLHRQSIPAQTGPAQSRIELPEDRQEAVHDSAPEPIWRIAHKYCPHGLRRRTGKYPEVKPQPQSLWTWFLGLFG